METNVVIISYGHTTVLLCRFLTYGIYSLILSLRGGRRGTLNTILLIECPLCSLFCPLCSAGAVSKDPSHSTSTPDSQHSHVPAISEEGEEEGEGEGEGSDPPAPTPHLSDISEETERGHDLAPPLSSSAIREEGTSSPPPSNSSRLLF